MTPLQAVTKAMRGNKRRDTKPEIMIRSRLHKLGLRFRKDFLIIAKGRKCRPDIVFQRHKLAIFIDGCFWHFCPAHGRIPQSNSKYWEAKFTRNVARDRLDNDALTEQGWKVLRLWEHVAPEEAVHTIVKKLDEVAGSAPSHL